MPRVPEGHAGLLPRCRAGPQTVRWVVFFGLLSYAPNVDGVIYFVQKIWPCVAEAHPEARFKIIGGRPPRSLQLLAGPRVELTGFVPDLRPHLAAAAAVVVPLRLGAAPASKSSRPWPWGKPSCRTRWAPRESKLSPGETPSSKTSQRHSRTR
jgi:polysaccharide biosynthesis protein PslH